MSEPVDDLPDDIVSFEDMKRIAAEAGIEIREEELTKRHPSHLYNENGNLDLDKMIEQGWELKDIPWTSVKYWDVLMDILGDDRVFLAGSKMPRGRDGMICQRGTFVVSPDAMKRLRAMTPEEVQARVALATVPHEFH